MCSSAMKSITVLWAAIATVASIASTPDCVVCLRGKCLAPAALYNNLQQLDFRKTAININDNILYYDDDSTLRSINLDDNTSELIPEIDSVTNKFYVDGVTGDVYYYKQFVHEKVQHTIYKYNPKTNETKIISIPNPENKKPPRLMWINNGKIYFTTFELGEIDTAKGLNTFDGTTVQKVPALENVKVHDIVFDESGKMYIRVASKMYIIKTNANGVDELTRIADSADTPFLVAAAYLTKNKNGELYVFDTGARLIYELDPTTYQLTKIGGYEEPEYAGLAIFDKNNNIIFRNRYGITYFKRTNDQCVFERVNRRVKVTKV